MMSFSRVSIRKTTQVHLLLVCFLLITLFPNNSVAAKSTLQDDPESRAYTLADFDYQTDDSFQCTNAEKIYGITFPQNWAFTTPALLQIKFSHSELLNPLSTLSVEWNDELLGAAQLTEDNSQNGTLEITIPPEKLIQGYNALKISFLMGISDNFFDDCINQNVWAVIHNDTSIEVSPQIVARDTKLNLAPDILVDSSLLADNNLTLLLPESPSLQHFNAMTVMATKLGQLADWRNLNVQAMTISEAKQAKPSGNLLLFATVDEVEELSQKLLPEINEVYDHYEEHIPVEEDTGFISFQTSPFDELYHILVLTGVTYDAMEKGARAAAFDDLYEQSDGTWAVIRNLTNIIDPVSDPLEITFSDLGYFDQSVTGTRELTIQYGLPISSLWNVDSEAWIDLHFSHSELLNKDLSTVSVLVNSIPVASFDLDTANAEDGYEEIRVPLRYLEVGENYLYFKINMEFSDEFIMMQDSCVPGITPRAWFNISSETTVRFPDVSKLTSLDLSSFPYGFSDPYTFDGFAVGIPANIDFEGLKGLVDIAVAFGKTMYGNPASIDLKFVNDDLSQFHEYDYVLLYGTAETLINPNLNEALPLQFSEDTWQLPEDSPLLIVETTSGTQAFLQTFQNDQSTIVLVLTAEGIAGLNNAGEFLANPGVRGSLEGNLAVITSAASASSYHINETSSPSNNYSQLSTDQSLSILSQYQSVWIVRVAIGVVILSLVVILIALFRKKISIKEP